MDMCGRTGFRHGAKLLYVLEGWGARPANLVDAGSALVSCLCHDIRAGSLAVMMPAWLTQAQLRPVVMMTGEKVYGAWYVIL